MFYFIYYYIFSERFFPIITESPYNPFLPAIPTLLSMFMSPFSLLLNPSTPTQPSPQPVAVSQLSFCESVSIFLLSSVYSLDSTYK